MDKFYKTVVNDGIVTEMDFKSVKFKEGERLAMKIDGKLLDYSVRKQNYNAYENPYAAQKQQETAKQKAASKQEVSETAAAQKNSGTESSKAKSTAEYMKELEKLAPSVEFRMGSSYATDKTGETLTINPKLLEKMQSDPAMEKKMKELIGGVEKMTKIVDNYYKAVGVTTVYRHSYIDANGKYSCIAFSVKKDKRNEKLRREAEENSKKQIEKTRENVRKKAEQLMEQLEEKAEKLLSEKLKNADDGKIYLDNDDMQTIINAAKEEAQGQPDQVKNPVVTGNNFEMQI